jgi:hypothetical protein
MEDFELEQELIQNRMKRFGQQGYQEPQGQMVGNQFVAPNVLQHLAAGLRGYGAIKGQAGAEQELKALQGKRRDAETRDMSAFVSALRGTPAQASTTTPTQMPSFDEADAQSMQGVQGYGATTGAQAATPGDPMAAYSLAAASQSPTVRQMGMRGIAEMPQIEARRQERVDDRTFRQSEAELAREARKAEQEAARVARMEQLQEQQAMRMQMLQEQNASREQMMQSQQDFQREMKKLGGGAASQPYFQPVQTAQGVMAFNARTGRVEPVMGANGQPVVGAQFDPALQGNLAASKASATTTAKSEAEATFEAPKVVAEADEAVRLVDDLLKAPGFKQAVGASRMLGVQKIPGTAARDFDIRLDQLQGKQFLQAFESLKGGGQITEIEGKKATDAIARMNASGSEAEFTKAAKEFQDVIRTGADRARKRIPAGQQSSAPVANPQDAAALQWARSNPNDPRSRAILQRLGQ